jgi:hypothetical protein
MKRKRMNKGSAMTLVLLTVLVVSLLIYSALYVTARGRDITSYYWDYTGMYDLAVAGNERVLTIFNEANGAVTEYIDEQERRLLIAGAFEASINNNGFVRQGAGYKLGWSGELVTDIREVFVGETTVLRDGYDFTIVTGIRKTTNGRESYPTTVRLDIEWPNNFDGNESPVLKSKRIAE